MGALSPTRTLIRELPYQGHIRHLLGVQKQQYQCNIHPIVPAVNTVSIYVV